MSNFTSALGDLFDFLFDQLSNFADFFTTNTLGMIILGIVLFSIITSLVMHLINRAK